MIGGNFAAIDGQAERARADIEIRGGIGQVDPGLLFIRLVAGDMMMATQGGYSLTCPSVAASCEMAVAVQNAGYDVVGCNACQDSDGFDQLTRSLGARLTASTARQT